jgi:hypothetical protein
MEDIIDIIVTETTNLIEITSQPTDEVIDVNIIDNREDITLNVTPSVVEININSLTGNFGVNWGEIGGTLSNQTDLQNALNLKADLVDGKVPSSQLPSYVDDVVEVATYSALPTTGETGKIYVVLDTNLIYRWSGSAYIEIKDSSAVWGAITGTLSSQTDLQNALNAKFNNPTGDSTQYLNGAGTPVTFPIAGQAGTLVREVRNTTGATLTKGTVVYISGATGNKPTVSKALATGDSTSAQTFGLCQADIANNSIGYVVCVGDIVGLDTSAISEGVQLYLSSTTAGTYTTTKQVAPAHLVYIGVVTRSHPTQGQIEVKIQNGYELDEIHDVLITSKANNDGLFYESSTSLWKNKSIATILGYSPEQPLTFSSPLSRSTNSVSIPAATSSVNGYLTSTDWTTFNAKQAALSGTGFVKISGTTISYDNSTYLTTSSAASTYLALTGGTMTGNIFLPANNTVGGTNYYIGQVMATSDNWKIYGNSTEGDKGELVFDLGDNGSPFDSGGQRFRFFYSAGADGTAKSPLIIDYNLCTFATSIVGTSATFSGALSGTSATFTGDLTISSTNPKLYLTDSDNNPDYYISNNNGVFTVYDVTNSLDRFTIGTTGNANFRNAIIGGGSITGESIYSNGIVSVGTSLSVGTFVSAGGSLTGSALYVSGMTAGSGAIYHTDRRLTFANYNASGTLHFEVNGGNGALTINSDTSASFNSTISATGATLTGALSGTSATFVTAGKDALTVSDSTTQAAGVGGSILFKGVYTNGGSPLSFGRISLEKQNSTNADYSFNLAFYTSPNNGSNPNTTAALKLNYDNSAFFSGNVGIGTTSPAKTLTVVNTAEQLRLSYDGSTTYADFRNDSAGGLLINTTGGYIINYIAGSAKTRINSNGDFIVYNLGTGLVYSNAGALTSTNPSDSRLKTDIKSIEYGLNDILKLRPVSYNWKDDKVNQGIQFGFIAQEVQEIMPDAIKEFGDKTKFLGLEKDAIYATLINAIKELNNKIETIENK